MSFVWPDYHLTQEERIKRWAVMYEAQKEDKWLWAFTDWMNENYWIPTVATILYLSFIFLGSRYMKNREGFNLQTPLVIWNGLLAGNHSFMSVSMSISRLRSCFHSFCFML